MAYCSNCGNQLFQNARFCSRCGRPAVDSAVNTGSRDARALSGIRRYEGVSREFPFVGDLTVGVSAKRDAMNEYMRQFRVIANDLAHGFLREYLSRCSTVDGYMEEFAHVNGKYVNEAAQKALGLLFSYGYYHYTAEDILNSFQSTPAFKALDEFHERNLELVNAYLKENYGKAADKIEGMGDQTYFGMGPGGMLLSYGISAATGALQKKRAEKLIDKSRKLTPAQEREFFSAVPEADVTYYVWDELINVGNTVICMLAELESDLIDWPFQEQIDEALRIFENMQNPYFPQDQLAGAAVYVLGEFPYIADLYPFLKNRFGDTPQIFEIEKYFYDPSICLFSQVFPEYGRY